MRAEEVEIAVPDGCSVRTLINVTPIRAEGGAIRSVVVTMQDLAPLDEIERLRTDSLGLVNHGGSSVPISVGRPIVRIVS